MFELQDRGFVIVIALLMALGPVAGTAVAQSSTSDAWEQQARLSPADSDYDDYGQAVDIDGTTALVGAPIEGDGAAYIFELENGEWEQAAKLTPNAITDPNGFADDIGDAVALAGDTALVGAPHADTSQAADVGAVYVFSEQEDGTWAQTDRLLSGDGGDEPLFGASLDFDGETAVVGAPIQDTSSLDRAGAAYVFELSNGEWSSAIRLDGPQLNDNAQLGKSVAVDAGTVLVGAPVLDGGGAVFEFQAESGWSHTDTLIPSDREDRDVFGWAVDIDGDTALVGDILADPGLPFLRTGAAYFFERDSSGTWSQTDKVARDDPEAQFGKSVALGGGVATVGAPAGDDDGSGEAFVYASAGSGWNQTARIDAVEVHARAGFADDVGMDGDMLIAGAPGQSTSAGSFTGTAYVFTACNEDGPASGAVHDEAEPRIGTVSQGVEDTVHATNCHVIDHVEDDALDA